MKEKKLISVILYVYNNEGTILDFLKQVLKQVDDLFEEFELIIVNDASTDASINKIKEAAFLMEFQVSIINMSFHQGVELSMNAGLDFSTGDFVYEFDTVVCDFDTALIEKSYRKLLKGFDIVTVSPSDNEAFTSNVFYKIYNYFSKSSYKLRTDRFRILSRRAINRSFSISVNIPYRKAMYINSGLKIHTIEFKKISDLKRKNEKSYLRKKTAIDSLIIYTNIAFVISIAISFLCLISTLLIIVYTVFIYFGKNKPIEGWTTIMLLVSGGFFGLFLLSAIIIKYLSLILELTFKKKSYIQENIEKI